jgi:hypothetical protein
MTKLRFLFGEDIDLTNVVFLIGLRELGAIKRKLSKAEKMDVMHVGVCTLLSQYGYYKFSGNDLEGWPHYERVTRLPKLDEEGQQKLLKKAVVDYLREV